MASVAAVSTIRGDTDIAPLSIRHMFDQGADSVWVAVGDRDAWDALREVHDDRLHLVWAPDRFHLQQHWTDKLADMAGAEWVVPFDADEFWVGLDVLNGLPDEVNVVPARLWHHQTWADKVIPAERLSKVAYRWTLGARIGPGNHDVQLPNVGSPSPVSLEVRHLQYRSFEHFCEKVAARNTTLAPEGRARGDGAHHLILEDASDAALWEAWRALCDRPTVHDPIPCSQP